MGTLAAWPQLEIHRVKISWTVDLPPTALTADYTVEILNAGKGSAKNQ